MRVVLAARRSELARIQAFQVGKALTHVNPKLQIDYSFHESLGDRNQNDPLWQMPEKGVFTQDLREGLLAGRYDLAVHSWKDLAIEDDGTTEIAATLPRADMRDLLLVRADRWQDVEATGRLTVLTSSPRRSYNLNQFLRKALPGDIKELDFQPVRGNVPTRVRKMWQPGADALVVAKAAIDRLLQASQPEFAETQAALRQALAACRWMVLPLRANPTAPAQGALAVEIKRDRAELRELLALINCAETLDCVQREREILSSYGGGCHQKIGANVLSRPYGRITFLRGLTDEGTVLSDATLQSVEPRPDRVSPAQMWPLKRGEVDWFVRESISASVPEAPLWISKADALPEGTTLAPSRLVWASGMKTWERLARRGIWVNGCAEGLGEHEPAGVETLADSSIDWLKLTHADAPFANGMRVLPTYRLIPKSDGPKLDGKRYFFWTSGSSFERALELNPEIRSRAHFCGPGNTQETLRRNGITPHVFLDHEQWLREMSIQ